MKLKDFSKDILDFNYLQSSLSVSRTMFLQKHDKKVKNNQNRISELSIDYFIIFFRRDGRSQRALDSLFFTNPLKPFAACGDQNKMLISTRCKGSTFPTPTTQNNPICKLVLYNLSKKFSVTQL